MRTDLRFPRMLTGLLAMTAVSAGQQVVAPSRDSVGPARGDNVGNYNIDNSFETGYRFATVGGNEAKYRSDENFRDGVRLLASYLNVNSKEGHGFLFDHLVLTTQGLGGDPYESAMLSVEKNRLYRYDLSWRRNDYFNPGLTTGDANGQHLLDTTYDLQDQDLELFPRSKVKFFLGFTNSGQSGAGLSTVLLFQPHGDLFPLFTNIKRSQNEYRLGNELDFFGLKLNWMHGWEDFKEDTGYAFSLLSLGDQPASGTSLNFFRRSEPYHGTSPFWRVALFGEKRYFSLNGRFTYTAGQRDFVLNESALGTMQVGAAANRQILTFGNGQRPVATGNLTLSLYPSSKITVVNQTSVYNIRTEGENVFTQFDNATQSVQALNFQYLGIRTVANDTDVDVETTRWLSLRFGYEYSNRLINSTQQFSTAGNTFAAPFAQTNELNTGRFGFRIRPLKPLTISLDAEVGSANRPFAPKSDANYHLIEGRVQYKLKTLQLSASTNADYNVNSVTLSTYSSHARTYSAAATWTPVRWLALDASYSKLHLDTVGGIAYFANAQFITGDQSYYISNIHSGNLGVRVPLVRRADLYLGYSQVQDTGDGRSTPLGGTLNTTLPALRAAQTFPLRFESPLARLSIRVNERIRWNLGYQYYGYREDFYLQENYRAHTGYTSLLWSF
ncbi:MAG: hypothetical protein ACR2IV_07660 [Bryobacteraceae bacterium]